MALSNCEGLDQGHYTVNVSGEGGSNPYSLCYKASALTNRQPCRISRKSTYRPCRHNSCRINWSNIHLFRRKGRSGRCSSEPVGWLARSASTGRVFRRDPDAVFRARLQSADQQKSGSRTWKHRETSSTVEYLWGTDGVRLQRSSGSSNCDQRCSESVGSQWTLNRLK